VGRLGFDHAFSVVVGVQGCCSDIVAQARPVQALQS
jgi:hypothetical protein